MKKNRGWLEQYYQILQYVSFVSNVHVYQLTRNLNMDFNQAKSRVNELCLGGYMKKRDDAVIAVTEQGRILCVRLDQLFTMLRRDILNKGRG